MYGNYIYSFSRGIGEADINSPPEVIKKADCSCPYLLLDVRERDDYDLCHIITGENAKKHNFLVYLYL